MCCHYTILHRAEDYYITVFRRLQTFFRNKILFFLLRQKYPTISFDNKYK